MTCITVTHLTRLVTLELNLMVPADDHERNEEEAQEEQPQGETVEITGQHTAEIGRVSDEKVQQPKKKRERKDPVVLMREAGKSLLPFARVQKIIKADKVCAPGVGSL